MPKTTQNQTTPKSRKLILNDAIDAITLSEIYHNQCGALFEAIKELSAIEITGVHGHKVAKHTKNIELLCSIGSYLSDEAANDADISHAAFESEVQL